MLNASPTVNQDLLGSREGSCYLKDVSSLYEKEEIFERCLG